VKEGDRRPPRIPQAAPPDNLPLGTCYACEAVLFEAFKEVAGGDASIWKSADRRAAERQGAEITSRWMRCRQCGRAFDTRSPEPKGEHR